MNEIQESIRRRVDAAMGRIECDGAIRNVRFLDVFTGKWRQGDIAWIDDTVVSTESGLRARREISGHDKTVVPGFIDAHVHIESSMLLPIEFERTVLKKGTTTAICDPHELANVAGVRGIEFFLKSAELMHFDLRVMLSSCVPATDFETNGAGYLRTHNLLPLRSHPQALGLAEMMNFPGVLQNAPDVVEKLAAFHGGPIDGHCPLLTGSALSAYAAAGIQSCHESTSIAEAEEKLSKGISVWIREGSVAKDLKALIPLLDPITSACMGFCTDDRNPLDIAQQGHLDYLIRRAIAYGADPSWVYRAASWSVARHYGMRHVGAVAPGYRADLVLLDDPITCAISKVICKGVPADEAETKISVGLDGFLDSVNAKIPEVADLEGPTGPVNIITVESGKILTGRVTARHNIKGVSALTVLERYGKGRPPANAYVLGFGDALDGAIASSVGHDSHNLITVGSTASDRRVALRWLIENGGGFCVVQKGQVISDLRLPIGGLMSRASAAEVTSALIELRKACRSIGCILEEPFLQLAFLSLPVIPSLKLTDRGLFDVDAFRLIDVRAA